MEKMGAQVTFRSGQPVDKPWFKGFVRLFPALAWRYSDRYYFSWLNEYGPANCDIIFIVKGEGLSPIFIKAMRDRYPNAHVILYLFDSMLNLPLIENKFPYIDEFFSFDPVDCNRRKKFKYRPLFFLDRYRQIDTAKPGRSIFFIGTLNGDRPKVISRLLANRDPGVFFDYWFFVRSRIELALRKVFDRYLAKLDAARFLFKPMPVNTITMHFGRSLAVLDIEHPNQAGLTMRTFEVIASGKKLITTNQRIREHEFYDPRRICVIDRSKPCVPADFFETEAPPLPADFDSRYSLRGWLREIFGIR